MLELALAILWAIPLKICSCSPSSIPKMIIACSILIYAYVREMSDSPFIDPSGWSDSPMSEVISATNETLRIRIMMAISKLEKLQSEIGKRILKLSKYHADLLLLTGYTFLPSKHE